MVKPRAVLNLKGVQLALVAQSIGRLGRVHSYSPLGLRGGFVTTDPGTGWQGLKVRIRMPVPPAKCKNLP